MFIRAKNIKKGDKKYEYAYIVENRWGKRKKEARQKVKGYLGRVYRPERKENRTFSEHHSITDLDKYVMNNDKNKIINDLIRLELINHGFVDDGKAATNGYITFDLGTNKFVNKKVVLAINEGFLCNETINRLSSSSFEGNEEEVGYKLAKAFVEAGINIPKDVFVGIFGKIVKD